MLVEYFDSKGKGSSKFYLFAEMHDVLIEDSSKFLFSFRLRRANDPHFNSILHFRLRTSEELQEWVFRLRMATMAPPIAAAGVVLKTNEEKGDDKALEGVVAEGSASMKSLVNDPQQHLRRESDPATTTSSLQRRVSEPLKVNTQLHRRRFVSDSFPLTESLNDDITDGEEEDEVLLGLNSSSDNDSESDYFPTRDNTRLHLNSDAGESIASGSVSEHSPTAPTLYDTNQDAYTLRTTEAVEYDCVEVFENQRWFPLGGWTTKMLIGDRYMFTSRHGHNRTELIKASNSPDIHIRNQAANEAGLEDKSQSSGPQVHVIKEPWVWEDAEWTLQPLIGLQSFKKDQEDVGISSPPSSSAAATTLSPPLPPAPRSPWIKSLSSFPSRLSHNNANTISSSTKSSESPTDEASHESPSCWALAFDFPDFDVAIARGVPVHYPSAIIRKNVRTRRWVRRRKRIIHVTARLPKTFAVQILPQLLSFNRQIVCEGWLGMRIHHLWKSRYFKLIRHCDGLWDDGKGRGLVVRGPTNYYLVCYECKERCQAVFRIQVEPHSIARLQAGKQVSQADILTTCLVKTTNRYRVEGDAGSLVLDGSEESHSKLSSLLEASSFESTSPSSSEIELPRAGRFEFAVSMEKTFLFSADTSVESQVWVSCLNCAAQELQESSSAAPPSSAQHGNKAAGLFQLVSKKIRNRTSLDTTDNPLAVQSTVPTHGDESNEGVSSLILEPMEPVTDAETPELNHALFSQHGKLRQWEDFELACNLPTFFTLFYSDKAKYTMNQAHEEIGDFDCNTTVWTKDTESTPTDDFDFPGRAPERMITCKSYTKSKFAVPVTRVEKHQRYFYYPDRKCLIIKSNTHSLDVPMGDSFRVLERWVVTEKADGAKVQIVIYLDIIFAKSPGMVGQVIKQLLYVQIPKNYLQWKKQAFALVRSLHSASTTTSSSDSKQKEEDGVDGSLMETSSSSSHVGWGKEMMVLVRAVVSGGVVLFCVWWMIALLNVLLRIATALEKNQHM